MDNTDYKEQFLKSMEMYGMTIEGVKNILDDALRHSKMSKEELEAERKAEIEKIERESEGFETVLWKSNKICEKLIKANLYKYIKFFEVLVLRLVTKIHCLWL